MKKPEQGLSRRNLLQGIASLTAGAAMPEAKLGAVLRAAASLPPDAVAFSGLVLWPYLLEPLHTNKDVVNGTVPLWEIGEPEPGLDKATRSLRCAWQQNCMYAAERLEACKKLEEFIASGKDIKPQSYFALIENPEGRGQIEKIIFHWLFGDVYTHAAPEKKKKMLKDGLSGVRYRMRIMDDLAVQQPSLKQAQSLKELITCLHSAISEALSLPRPKGFLNNLVTNDTLGDLHRLLREVPELFPKGTQSAFEQLARDLDAHGHQTIEFEEREKSQTDWRLHAENIPYRLLGESPIHSRYSDGRYAEKIGKEQPEWQSPVENIPHRVSSLQEPKTAWAKQLEERRADPSSKARD